jgi:disulfide bond formation protein DsbB
MSKFSSFIVNSLGNTLHRCAAMRNILGYFFLAASVLPLLVAYFMQYGLDFQPCLLCLYQRVPFFIIAALALVSLLFKPGQMRATLYALCVVAFAANAGLAFYHAGVEYRIFHNIFSCATKSSLFAKVPNSIEDIARQLTGDQSRLAIARCDDAPFRILGLSPSGWTAIYCIVCLIVGSMGAKAKRRLRRAI